MSAEVPDPVDATSTQPEPVAPQVATDEQRVPLDRFRSVTAENATLKSELDELKAWKDEQEQASLSEIERERQAREKAEAEATAASAMVAQLERGAWVRTAAMAAGFADPEDAVALANINTLENAEAAAEAVKNLADAKPHLLAAQSGPQPMGGTTPATTREVAVGPDGQPDYKSALARDLLSHIRRGQS
jgi:hypothetical protein